MGCSVRGPREPAPSRTSCCGQHSARYHFNSCVRKPVYAQSPPQLRCPLPWCAALLAGAAWTWASLQTPPCLSLLICKMGATPVLTILSCRSDGYMTQTCRFLSADGGVPAPGGRPDNGWRGRVGSGSCRPPWLSIPCCEVADPFEDLLKVTGRPAGKHAVCTHTGVNNPRTSPGKSAQQSQAGCALHKGSS